MKNESSIPEKGDETMSAKTHLSRMTIDIPEEDHKRLKALAAVLGKSMREIVADWPKFLQPVQRRTKSEGKGYSWREEQRT